MVAAHGIPREQAEAKGCGFFSRSFQGCAQSPRTDMPTICYLPVASRAAWPLSRFTSEVVPGPGSRRLDSMLRRRLRRRPAHRRRGLRARNLGRIGVRWLRVCPDRLRSRGRVPAQRGRGWRGQGRVRPARRYPDRRRAPPDDPFGVPTIGRLRRRGKRRTRHRRKRRMGRRRKRQA